MKLPEAHTTWRFTTSIPAKLGVTARVHRHDRDMATPTALDDENYQAASAAKYLFGSALRPPAVP